MKRKYVIHDEDGKKYDVEEVAEETTVEEPMKDEGEEAVLTADEILELKKLAGIADKLVKLLEVEEAEHAATEEDAEPVEDEDEDEEINDGCDEEEVVDTAKPRDSKRSFGAIETSNKTTVDDSLDEDDISAAWSKRYNNQLGGNK